jgi:hypothetical protein
VVVDDVASVLDTEVVTVERQASPRSRQWSSISVGCEGVVAVGHFLVAVV